MTPDQIRDVVFQELGNIAPEAEPEQIDPDADLRDEIDIDSMDFLNFVIALHERLKVDIPEADYAKLGSINGIVAYLAAKAAV